MARDGMRGQTYARQRVTPRTDRATPSDIIAQATITDGGFVIHLRHPEQGLLGRVAVSALEKTTYSLKGMSLATPMIGVTTFYDPAGKFMTRATGV
jgi:hypothetical protein